MGRNRKVSCSKVKLEETSSSENAEAKTEYSIPEAQKVNLRAKDEGRCLITCQVDPLTIKASRILTPRSQQQYQKMWGLKELNIDTTDNLVSLRADYHDSYDGGTWTFVPSMEVLDKIQAQGEKGIFTKPCKGFKPAQETRYMFVHFPTFRRHFIHRDLPDKSYNTYHAADGFGDFPILRHHSHPYFSIANAYPKFIKHKRNLTEEQRAIFRSLKKIHDIWDKVDSSAPKPSKRKRKRDQDEGDGSMGDDGGARKGTRKTQRKPAATDAKSTTSQPKESDAVKKYFLRQTYPSPPASRDAHTDSKIRDEAARRQISTWVHNVTVARPLPAISEDVILPDGETAREPYRGDWHDWCYPWKSPSKWSMFSSNDWAMHQMMCKLTAEPGDWANLSSDTSDGEFDWPDFSD